MTRVPACIPPASIVYAAMCHQLPPAATMSAPYGLVMPHQAAAAAPKAMQITTHATTNKTTSFTLAVPLPHIFIDPTTLSLLPLCIRCPSYHVQIRLGGVIAHQKGCQEYILCHGCQLFLSLWLPLFIYHIRFTCLSPTTHSPVTYPVACPCPIARSYHSEMYSVVGLSCHK